MRAHICVMDPRLTDGALLRWTQIGHDASSKRTPSSRQTHHQGHLARDESPIPASRGRNATVPMGVRV